VKHLVSPFTDPSHSPTNHHHQEKGSPSSSTTSLTVELGSVPNLLRKRESGNSVKSATMKNQPSPYSSPSPPSPTSRRFPSHDMSSLSPNPNHPSPDIDHQGSPTRKRERVKSIVNGIRRSSSQLFKKDKKDGRPHSTIASLAAESLSLGTAPTTPTILRRFSHSKHPSTTTTSTTGSDISTGYTEIKIGSVEGSLTSPIFEVVTPISPTVAQPAELPTVVLSEEATKEEEEEEESPESKPETSQSLPPLLGGSLPEEAKSQPAGTASENPETSQSFPPLLGDSLPSEAEPQPAETVSEIPDPLVFPLPPSPVSSPSPMADPDEPIRTFVDEQVDATLPNEAVHDDDAVAQPEETPQRDAVPQDKSVPDDDAVTHDNGAAQDSITPHDDPASHDDEEPRPDDEEVSSQDVQVQPSTTTDPVSMHPVSMDPASTDPVSVDPASTDPVSVDPASPDPASTISPSEQTSQPSPALASPPAAVQHQQDICIPVVIPPMLFWPISNMRLSFFFTPVLTWWLAKGVVNYPSFYS
jgi:hypothetical protein